MFGLPAIISATPFAERHLNPLQNYVMDFARSLKAATRSRS
jgi:hypothetical protein